MINPCELTAAITAIANALSGRLSVEQLSLLGAICNQLGDNLATIAAQRSICENSGSNQ